MFDGILLKITSILSAILIITSLILGSLYLGTRDKLVALETQHTQLKQELKECSEGKSKVVEGAKQDDTINVEKEDNISVLKDEKDLLLKKLSDLQNTRKCTPKQPTPSSENVNEIINVNDSWDADVQQLLDNTYRSNKRDSDPTP